MNILLCEDDKGIQELIFLLLESEGYNLSCVSTVKEAKNLLQSQKFNLIILDYWLEDSVADSLVDIIKSISPSTPTLLISAAGNLDELNARLKVSDYLQKPFDIINFQSKVKKLLHDHNISTN